MLLLRAMLPNAIFNYFTISIVRRCGKNRHAVFYRHPWGGTKSPLLPLPPRQQPAPEVDKVDFSAYPPHSLRKLRMPNSPTYASTQPHSSRVSQPPRESRPPLDALTHTHAAGDSVPHRSGQIHPHQTTSDCRRIGKRRYPARPPPVHPQSRFHN